MINSFNHKLKRDKVLEKWFRTWCKHAIGDSLHRENHMNDIVVEFLWSMLNKKTRVFYFPMSNELGIIDEIQFIFHDKEGNEVKKRHDLLLKDQEFILSMFGKEKTKPIEDTLCDCINDGPISFI